MTTLPHHVRVGAHRYQVTTDSAIGDRGANGETYRERCQVVMNPNLAPTMEREVLLHELLHAVWGAGALVSIDHPASAVEEQVCHALAPPLLQLLRDNPELLAYLAGEPTELTADLPAPSS